MNKLDTNEFPNESDECEIYDKLFQNVRIYYGYNLKESLQEFKFIFKVASDYSEIHIFKKRRKSPPFMCIHL